MFLRFKLIFLLLAVAWSDATHFDVVIIPDVSSGSYKNADEKLFEGIAPGTLWCGPGNISTSIDDLGWFKDTDSCCRSHDMCDDLMEAGETRYNLTNSSRYTRLSCKCDQEFYNCLTAVDSFPSRRIRDIYFNLLGRQCYRLAYPPTGCVKKVYKPLPRCTEYSYDTSKEMIFQWFDVLSV